MNAPKIFLTNEALFSVIGVHFYVSPMQTSFKLGALWCWSSELASVFLYEPMSSPLFLPHPIYYSGSWLDLLLEIIWSLPNLGQ